MVLKKVHKYIHLFSTSRKKNYFCAQFYKNYKMKPRFSHSVIVFFIVFVYVFALVSVASAQGTTSAFWRYIENYKDMAIDQMQRYRIPASITLAQGLCESGAGQSKLAREAHNHFGIKVGMNWTGPYVILSDDRPDDRFRKYRTDDESYEDHSRFLSNNQRYASLFRLNITDYKGWARGLKACGYATNPRYADMLIKIIEDYNLMQFDSGHTGGRYRPHQSGTAAVEANTFYSEHIVYHVNKNYLIIANRNDTWERIASETGVSKRKLLKYNDLPKDAQLHIGDVIYLQKKQSKADKAYRAAPHIVQPGESLHSIAQLYGVRLKALYKINHLPADYEIKVGDEIWVR